MRAQIYLLLHLSGVLLVFVSYGMLIARSWLTQDHVGVRKLGAILSGIGLFLILLGGFGILSVIHANQFHPWVVIKIVVWVALGGMIVLINRKPGSSRAWLVLTIFLGIVAVWAGVFRPGGV